MERQMDALRQDLARFFDEIGRRVGGVFNSGAFSPPIDMRMAETAIQVTVELPGVESADVDVSVAGNVLTIRGEKNGDEAKGLMHERRYGAFERTVPLPFVAENENIEATFKNGVLTILISRPENVKATTGRKVDIKAE